ncbi:MAG: hypothetical protein V3T31_02765, partial [candidate division Zixibacteria bacterium]
KFTRGSFDVEEWAPLGQLLSEKNIEVLKRVGAGEPDRMDFSTQKYRVVVCERPDYSLLVVADRQCDDLVHIRINQSWDTIAKFVAERYQEIGVQNTEKSHVSST